MSKPVTRRDYLKTAAGAVGGLVVGGAIGYGSYPALNPPAPAPQKEAQAPTSFLQGGTLNITYRSPVMNLDPHIMTDEASYGAAENTMDPLVVFEGNTANIIPNLAYAWEISDDAKEYTFHLWKGVKFHDGTELTANDVKFTIERILAPETKASMYAYFSSIDRVEVVDDYTVKVILKAPQATMLAAFATAIGVIMNKKKVEELKGDLSSTTFGVGSGPFRFVEWKVNDHLTLEANGNYWAGRPYLDRILVKEIPERTTRAVAVQTGEIDVGEDIPYDMIEQMKGNKDLVTLDDHKIGAYYMGFNCSQPPFKDNVKLRQALSYGVDYDAVLAQFKGHLARSLGPYGPNLWGYPEDVKGYYLDAVKAKQLLADAGYPNGLDVTMHAADWNIDDGQICAASLAKIGVNVKIVHLDAASLDAAVTAGKETQLFMMGWGADLPDPDNVLYVILESNSPLNWVHWKNATFDDLVHRAREISDQTERSSLYKDAFKIVMDEAPAAWLHDPGFSWALSKHIRGFQVGPHYQYLLKGLWKK